MAKKWELKLYIAGQTTKSVTALSNLKKYCERHLKGMYTIEVIDLLKSPSWRKETRYLRCQRL